MDKNRYEKGLEKLREIDGKSGENVMEALSGIAPDLGRYIIEFAFGDIYGRSGLNLIEKETVTLGCLLSLGGCEKQLEVHINGALNVGISKEKIVEIFLQCIPYVGFPRVLNAVFTMDKVFKSREHEGKG